MNTSSRLVVNALASLGQVATSVVALFTLYRYLLHTLGAEALGTWSLVTAMVSVARIGELGMSGSIVKFVAKFEASGNHREASGLTITAAAAAALSLGVFLAAAYPVYRWVLPLVLPEAAVESALQILPLALVVAWTMGVSGVFSGALEGQSRIDLRVLVTIASLLALVIAAFCLVPIFSLRGIVAAQLVQFTVIGCLSAALFKRKPQGGPRIAPLSITARLRMLVSYGTRFQLITVMVFLFDPITKAILGRFGGLSSVAYFEMANKMVMQVRGIIVSANQVVVPHIAHQHEVARQQVLNVYRRSWKLLCYFAFPLFAALAAAIPVISILWIGSLQMEFVVFAAILTGANIVNVMSGPAYFSNLGEGDLSWNSNAHIAMAVVNGILGVLLGSVFGANGVVAGYAIALMIGSAVVVFAFHARKHIKLTSLIDREDLTVIGCSTAAAAAAVPINFYVVGRLPVVSVSGIVLVAFLVIMALPLWHHSTRVWLFRRLRILGTNHDL